jgi:Transposase
MGLESQGWDPDNTLPIRPRGSRVSRTCQRRSWSNDRAGSEDVSVRVAGALPIVMRLGGAPCTTSAACGATVAWTSTSRIPNIDANPAVSALTRRWMTLPLQGAIIPTESSLLRCAWWWRTACLTGSLRGISGAIIEFSSPSLRFRTGSRRRGKKIGAWVETDYLDWALSDFSGYVAADELYDGPFCVLSVVDSRRQRRLLYEVLDHDPEHEDIRCFLERLRTAVAAHGSAMRGITTDASPLYPQPIAQVFGQLPHQICEFHILKELTKAVLRVVARLRKQLAAQAPKLPRGRPKNTPEAKRLYRQAKSIQDRVTELFDHRHLFVRHHMTPGQRTKVQQLVCGNAQLRALRAIMDEVYRLFDRRCRTDTALAKLARLRRRVRRYRSLGKSLDKLHSPNLEKALTFLNDKLLPATSNAVERGNRRHRKMQKTVYRVRTKTALTGRMALDLCRDQRAQARAATTATLHAARQTPV